MLTSEVKNIILFDGVCNLCNSTVNFIMRHDKRRKFYFSSLQSDIGKHYQSLLSEQVDSILYIREGKIHSKSNAALYIAKDLGFPWSLLFLFKFIPTFLRDRCYDLIAKYRYKWFGKHDLCRVPTEAERSRFI